jgi:hypothetical protein
MVSINARVRNPKVAKKRARNPVKALCPKAMRKIIAQAAIGIFRFTEAMSRERAAKKPFGLVVTDPMSAKGKATTAAVTEAMMDMEMVSMSLSKIRGKRLRARASGMRLVAIQAATLGIAVKASSVSKPVNIPAHAEARIMPRRKTVISSFCRLKY